MNNEEGCLVEGTVIINKVPGNFHLSSHAFGEVIQRLYMSGRNLDFSHTINHLSFGNDKAMKQIMNKYNEKMQFDLDGTHIEQSQYLHGGQILVNYYLDINQIDYHDIPESKKEGSPVILEGFKYKSTKSIFSQMGQPALFFRYELSPIKIRYTMYYQQWSEYLVNICAIIGGLFVVTGIIEAVLRNSISIVAPGDAKKH